MQVKEVAKLSGCSVRTLHHYDEIGLLKPAQVTQAGYRIYSQENLETLQQILFFKELGFSLKKVKAILEHPDFDRLQALQTQQQMLLEKRKRLEQMLETIEKTIQLTKGEINMTNQEKFSGFNFSYNPYEQEARERWGDKVVAQTNQRAASLSIEEQKRFNEIFQNLAAVRHLAPDSEEAQNAVAEWYDELNKLGDYSLQAFRNLGEMYIQDERFTKNIDQFGTGLALFMRTAMASYAEHRKK